MKVKAILYTFIFFLLSMGHSFAQCAMCRATVENNINTGETSVGAGLNYGILYLFMAPYLLAMFIGYIWYRNYKKQKALKSKIQHL